VPNNDELRELGHSFNAMVEKTRGRMEQYIVRNEELTNIISSIHEGVLVLDTQGRITLCNHSFKKIFNKEIVEGKYYWEVLRDVKLSEVIGRITVEERYFTEEIQIDEETFLCSANFIISAQRIVLILHEITEIRNLALVKKDFVANVSHELRTPLTAIKGFAETLEEESSARHKKYFAIIKKHTDRITRIIQDLLLLSELEERGFLMERGEVNLEALVGNVLKIFGQKASEKDLSVKVDIHPAARRIRADAFKLEQLLINLVDNAIKYTEKGEIRITSTAYNGLLKIEVRDTGIGIPREHLGRIFERFYVVDKSRSKKLGGTGLGLSIVKHIVLLHNGEISVESKPKAGTHFTISLPISWS
jgi:two-component system phosphate regulon sensor histidine kinase PhoR